MELFTIIFIGLVFSGASLVHGICGFGFSLISVGVLSMILGPRIAVPMDIIAASANCFYLTWLLRKDIMWKETLVLTAISIIFVPFGTMFVSHFDAGIVIRSLGMIIVFVSIISMVKKNRSSIFANHYPKWLAGAISGLLGGAFNTPGPPLVLYSFNSHWPIRNAMANLQLYFSLMVFVITFSFWWQNLLNWSIVGIGAMFTPIVILFTFVGSMLAKRLTVSRLAIIVNVAMLVLGVVLLVKG